jgi:protein phosphatase
MTGELELNAWQLTDVGREREHNEDYCGSFEPQDSEVLRERGRLYLVADGIGGHQAGDVAARYAVERVLYSYFNDPWVGPAENLRHAMRRANSDLYQEAQQNLAHRGMGTTMVAAAIRDHELTVANVGDSRAYLLRGGSVRQISQDHSWVAEQVAANVLTPEQARNHPKRNVITRSLGNDPDVSVDVFHEILEVGDAVVLCTDGLSGLVGDGDVAAVVSHASARAAAERLVRLANENGGHDNITVTVIRVPEPVPVTGEARSTPLRVPAPAEPVLQSRWAGVLAVVMIAVGILGLGYVVPRLGVDRSPTASPSTTGTSPQVVVPATTVAPTEGGVPTGTWTTTSTPTPTGTLTQTPTSTTTPSVTLTATTTPTSTPVTPVATATQSGEGGPVAPPGPTRPTTPGSGE